MQEVLRHWADEERPFVTVREAAEILGKSRGYIYDQVRARRINFYKPNGGRLLFARRDVEAFRRDCLHNGGRIYQGRAVTLDFYLRAGK